jgi:hypothetical protein
MLHCVVWEKFSVSEAYSASPFVCCFLDLPEILAFFMVAAVVHFKECMNQTWCGIYMQIVITREKEKQNPGCVVHYNQNMGAPNKNNLLLQNNGGYMVHET